jgi:hypothetical protein
MCPERSQVAQQCGKDAMRNADTGQPYFSGMQVRRATCEAICCFLQTASQLFFAHTAHSSGCNAAHHAPSLDCGMRASWVADELR